MRPYEIKPYVVEPASTVAREASAARWFVPEWTMFPVSPRRCLVRNALNGATMELSSGEYAVLSSCQGCGRLDEHVARAERRLAAPPEHRPAFREVLERCAQAGLLMPLSALLARCGTPRGERGAALAGVAIRTCDRPALLERLLASARRLEAAGGEPRRWFVFDDSRAAQNETANRAVVCACGVDATYVSPSDASALASELRAEFPGAEGEIAWLLHADASHAASYGRPLNHALLRFAGKRFVAVDDDVVLEARRPALSEPGFAVNESADELLWFASEEAMWRECPALDIDPIAAHESWLGLPLPDAWARAEREAGTLADLEIGPQHGSRFAPDARVLFTHGHACGDPGSTLLPLQLLTLPALSRRRLSQKPETARDAFAARINWRGQARLRLTPKRVLTFTTATGVDGSTLVPPTARSYRSEDVLLGIVAQCMYPSSWFVDLPFALAHLREPRKTWISSDANFMQEPLHVLYAWIEENAVGIVAQSAAERLEAMGRLLCDHARMSDPALSEALWRHAADAGSRTLFAIEQQLDDAALPGEWKTQLAAWRHSPAFALDDRSVRGRVLAPELVRGLADAYGRAMQIWPRLWNHCGERNR